MEGRPPSVTRPQVRGGKGLLNEGVQTGTLSYRLPSAVTRLLKNMDYSLSSMDYAHLYPTSIKTENYPS